MNSSISFVMFTLVSCSLIGGAASASLRAAGSQKVEPTKVEPTKVGTNYMSQPCGTAPKVADRMHDLGVTKGQFLAALYSKCEVKNKESKRIALLVDLKAGQKVKDSKNDAAALDGKISAATSEDNVKDPTTGASPKMSWMDKHESELAEAEFYEEIVKNADTVLGKAQKGQQETALLKKKVMAEFHGIDEYTTDMQVRTADCAEVYDEAMKLWKQWEDSSKDYNCGPPVAVNHAETMCKNGNTKFSPKCHIKCMPGYDDPKDSKNNLRCRKEGKFGKQLYGEWKGMAACMGRMCGKPNAIEKAKVVGQNIRFPHGATYNCYEGYSTDGEPASNKSFVVPCGETGHFETDMSHTCKRIKCGAAPVINNSFAIKGNFLFGDILNYTCKPGYTLDATPGGLTGFTTSCQTTGRFTLGQVCKRVRCGPAPEYDHTTTAHEKADLYFGDEITYDCKAGHSTDQTCSGARKFTKVCAETGELVLKGGSSDRCAAISAGLLPEIKHGKAKHREMFFGDTAIVTADVGHSTSGKAMEGRDFIVGVNDECGFMGIEEIVPVNCGAPPSVKMAKTNFIKKAATFGDILEYKCEDGYSTDKSVDAGAASFSIKCEADGDYSRIPGLGYCANIDDCAEHTCGPHGECVDKLMDYTCKCDSGYEISKDNKTGELVCGNIDDCGPEACGVGKCKDLVNDFKCICPTGYEQVGEGKEKTCAAKICGTPPAVDHALTSPLDLAVQKASYGDSILYQCSPGHSLNATPVGKNHFSIDCQADKTFTATKDCKPIECGPGPTVEHAIADPAAATFNESIRYTCADGYTIDGTTAGDSSFGLTCLVTGKYSEVSECKPVNCGTPDDVPNAHRPSGSIVYKESAKYTCFEGFTLDGKRDGETEFTVKCHADGSLDKVKMCLPKVCGVPGKYINALHSTTADEGSVAYPRQTQVTCRDGYTVGGKPWGNTSFNVACLSTGFFDEYDKKSCDPVVCGPPPTMANATLDYVWSPHESKDVENLNFEEKAFYKCAPGFSTGGEPNAPTSFKVECLPSGELSAPSADMQCRNINDCEQHTCGPKGKCVDLIGPSPAYTCECEFGFELQTKANGEKHCGNTDDCKDQDCGVGVCKDLVGDYTCICPAGHVISETSGADDDLVEPEAGALTFLDFGAKRAGRKTCVPVVCATETPVLTHGKQLSDHSGPVAFPRTLRYKCDEGYSVDGTVAAAKRQFQAQCKAEGELVGMMSCQKISCGTPRVLPFTQLLAPMSASSSVDFKEPVNYKCFDGYTIGGRASAPTTFSVSCPDSGHLTDPEVCEPVKCGLAPAIPKARAGIAGDVFFGMTLTYSCDAGYTLDGSVYGGSRFNIDCKVDGKFSALPGSEDAELMLIASARYPSSASTPCKAVSGGVAPTIANADMTEYAGRPVVDFPPNIFYPNGLEYKCNPGFSENGSPSGATKISTRVDTRGKLSPPLPEACHPIVFDAQGLVKNSVNGQALSGVTVSVTSPDDPSFSSSVQSSGGHFTLRGLSPGGLKFKYAKSGFITVEKTITLSSDISVGGEADVSMSPQMQNDQWRAVLKWGRRPTDLDTYGKWGFSKVYWSGKRRRSNGIKGVLEHDDTDSYGPETLYLSGVGKCRGGAYYCDIKYAINDYTRSGNMKDVSDAEVSLYTGSKLAGTWKIKDCANSGTDSVSSDGNWWHVFTLDGTTNKVKWHCNQPPTTTTTTTAPPTTTTEAELSDDELSMDDGELDGDGDGDGDFDGELAYGGGELDFLRQIEKSTKSKADPTKTLDTLAQKIKKRMHARKFKNRKESRNTKEHHHSRRSKKNMPAPIKEKFQEEPVVFQAPVVPQMPQPLHKNLRARAKTPIY